MSAWEDIGNKPPETAAEALARWNASLAAPPMTEQQLAEAEVERREKMRQHDAHFAGDFISASEERIISRSLARKLGHFINEDFGADDGR